MRFDARGRQRSRRIFQFEGRPAAIGAAGPTAALLVLEAEDRAAQFVLDDDRIPVVAQAARPCAGDIDRRSITRLKRGVVRHDHDVLRGGKFDAVRESERNVVQPLGLDPYSAEVDRLGGAILKLDELEGLVGVVARGQRLVVRVVVDLGDHQVPGPGRHREDHARLERLESQRLALPVLRRGGRRLAREEGLVCGAGSMPDVA